MAPQNKSELSIAAPPEDPRAVPQHHATKTTEPGPDEGSVKKQAEEALKLGDCLVEYYGEAFCKKLYQQEVTTVSEPSEPPVDGGDVNNPLPTHRGGGPHSQTWLRGAKARYACLALRLYR